MAVPDGLGGVIIASAGIRNPSTGDATAVVIGQHITNTGVQAWGSGGTDLLSASAVEYPADIVGWYEPWLPNLGVSGTLFSLIAVAGLDDGTRCLYSQTFNILDGSSSSRIELLGSCSEHMSPKASYALRGHFELPTALLTYENTGEMSLPTNLYYVNEDRAANLISETAISARSIFSHDDIILIRWFHTDPEFYGFLPSIRIIAVTPSGTVDSRFPSEGIVLHEVIEYETMFNESDIRTSSPIESPIVGDNGVIVVWEELNLATNETFIRARRVSY